MKTDASRSAATGCASRWSGGSTGSTAGGSRFPSGCRSRGIGYAAALAGGHAGRSALPGRRPGARRDQSGAPAGRRARLRRLPALPVGDRRAPRPHRPASASRGCTSARGGSWRSGGCPRPTPSSASATITLAPDESTARLRRGTVRGPATVVLRHPFRPRAAGSSLRVDQEPARRGGAAVEVTLRPASGW